MNLGHWNWSGTPFDIHAYMGFVYEISLQRATKRIYYGRKQFWYKRGEHWYESDWRTYTGSSRWLNDDIGLYGIKAFKFEIRSIHKSKSSLRYAETKVIVCTGCLEQPDRFYNRSFEGMRGLIRKDCLDEFK